MAFKYIGPRGEDYDGRIHYNGEELRDLRETQIALHIKLGLPEDNFLRGKSLCLFNCLVPRDGAHIREGAMSFRVLGGLKTEGEANLSWDSYFSMERRTLAQLRAALTPEANPGITLERDVLTFPKELIRAVYQIS